MVCYGISGVVNSRSSRQKAKYSLDEVLGQEPGTAWGMEVSVVAV